MQILLDFVPVLFCFFYFFKDTVILSFVGSDIIRKKTAKQQQCSVQFKEQVGFLFLATEKVPRKPLWYFDTLKKSLLSSSMLTRHGHRNAYVTSKEQLKMKNPGPPLVFRHTMQQYQRNFGLL